MAAFKGDGAIVLVKITDDAGSPALQTIGGMRSRTISFNNETVDITHAESTGMWRELLSGAGVHSCTISGDGVFLNDAGFIALQDASIDRTNRVMNFTITGYGTFSGSFRVSKCEMSAEYNGAAMFSATFESAGAITFA